jgi:hypothetical protein
MAALKGVAERVAVHRVRPMHEDGLAAGSAGVAATDAGVAPAGPPTT